MKSQPKTPLERDHEKTRPTGELTERERIRLATTVIDLIQGTHKEELDNDSLIYDCPVCGSSDCMTEKQLHDYENRGTTIISILDELDGANSYDPSDRSTPDENVAKKLAELRSRYQVKGDECKK